MELFTHSPRNLRPVRTAVLIADILLFLEGWTRAMFISTFLDVWNPIEDSCSSSIRPDPTSFGLNEKAFDYFPFGFILLFTKGMLRFSSIGRFMILEFCNLCSSSSCPRFSFLFVIKVFGSFLWIFPLDVTLFLDRDLPLRLEDDMLLWP